MIRRRTLQEALDHLGGIEAAIAAVELALTRLEFAMARLPDDMKIRGRSTLLESEAAFRTSLPLLLEEHRLILTDLERIRSSAGGASNS